MLALNKKLKTKNKTTANQKKKKDESPFVLALSFLIAKHNSPEDKNQLKKFIITKSMSTNTLAELIFFLLRNFFREWWRWLLFARVESNGSKTL